jgi:hypothetical protein
LLLVAGLVVELLVEAPVDLYLLRDIPYHQHPGFIRFRLVQEVLVFTRLVEQLQLDCREHRPILVPELLDQFQQLGEVQVADMKRE